jgi:hypothetical protein
MAYAEWQNFPVVLALHKQGLSTRKIAEIVHADQKTVWNDIAERITGNVASCGMCRISHAPTKIAR